MSILSYQILISLKLIYFILLLYALSIGWNIVSAQYVC